MDTVKSRLGRFSCFLRLMHCWILIGNQCTIWLGSKTANATKYILQVCEHSSNVSRSCLCLVLPVKTYERGSFVLSEILQQMRRVVLPFPHLVYDFRHHKQLLCSLSSQATQAALAVVHIIMYCAFAVILWYHMRAIHRSSMHSAGHLGHLEHTVKQKRTKLQQVQSVREAKDL